MHGNYSAWSQNSANVGKEYGIDINVKKTKTLVINKSGHTNCTISINGSVLEQVLQYKYLGSWITEDGRCELDIKSRIGMAKDTFWRHKELLRGKINLKVKKGYQTATSFLC